MTSAEKPCASGRTLLVSDKWFRCGDDDAACRAYDSAAMDSSLQRRCRDPSLRRRGNAACVAARCSSSGSLAKWVSREALVAWRSPRTVSNVSSPRTAEMYHVEGSGSCREMMQSLHCGKARHQC